MCVIQQETSIKVSFSFGQCPWLHSQGSGTSHIQPTFFKSYRGPWLLLLLPRTLAVAAAMLASFWHVYQPKRWREKIWAKALKNFHFTVKGSTLDPSGILWWETGGRRAGKSILFKNQKCGGTNFYMTLHVDVLHRFQNPLLPKYFYILLKEIRTRAWRYRNWINQNYQDK